MATRVIGLTLSGPLKAVIISSVGLDWARSSFETYVRLLTSARFFWVNPLPARIAFSTAAKAFLSVMNTFLISQSF
jgi:hypothetical protein